MALSGLEIQANLTSFVQRWSGYQGTEKSEAQTFLNELFACYGSDRLLVGARFEDFRSSAGFMDLHWPEVCIVEMKRPGTDPATARRQIQRYWVESADEAEGRRAARYVVICSFDAFEIWQPGEFPKNPRVTLRLEDLPSRYDALAFLAGPQVEPSFVEHDREMTKEAAGALARVYESLVDRVAAPPQDIQRFVMQSVWCMFAEDLRMLQDWPFERTVHRLLQDPSLNSAKELGWLFRVLNQKGKQNRVGELAGTTYVNGDLFAEPAEVTLRPDELRWLSEATSYDWSQVDPTIFGSLMEGVLGDRRWELGAHYTHEVDIMKIVGPTIVAPWRERIEATATPAQARDLLDELCRFRVLDPACGCGNFLYVAYRELRELEFVLKQRIRDLAQETGLPVPPGPWPFVPLTNMQGIEIEPASALIARVTLWMGHRQMIERFGEAEQPLPLVTLSSIKTADALRVPWPETDCIVGNPPFLGAKLIRPTLGDDYADWLIRRFQVGVKDLCTYWFRLAADHLSVGQRAGLVGTNSVSQTSGRSASLDYVVAHGVITDAVSTQKWPGDAKVHVSIVNWVRDPSADLASVLDGREVDGISSQLRERADSSTGASVLAANRGRSFAGVVPQAKGFTLSKEEAFRFLDSESNSAIVVPFLNGEDVVTEIDQGPSRYVIDFRSRTLEDAMQFPGPLDHVRATVRPEREASTNRAVERRWWLHGRRVEPMRAAIDRLERWIAVPATGKRLVAAWQSSATLANNAVCVFAFDDDFSMAVLQSRAHVAWAWQQASTLKGDLRYTPTSVFMTFPWPDQATQEQRDAAADASRRLLAHRAELCREFSVGLTKLYNAMDEGAHAGLAGLHREVDVAVAACYGWPASVAQDDRELVRRLRDLNQEIVEGARPYAPFD